MPSPSATSPGACAQLAIVWFAARRGLDARGVPPCPVRWREILMKPAFFVVYAAGIGLNIAFTRAYATHAGPEWPRRWTTACAASACRWRSWCNPISNSLLPEIARLRSLLRLREALRLIDKTIALTALVAVGGCAFALIFRAAGHRPALPARQFHRRIHPHGGLRRSSAGAQPDRWSLIEILARSLFAWTGPGRR